MSPRKDIEEAMKSFLKCQGKVAKVAMFYPLPVILYWAFGHFYYKTMTRWGPGERWNLCFQIKKHNYAGGKIFFI